MNREEVMQMLTANASALELSTWLRNTYFPEIVDRFNQESSRKRFGLYQNEQIPANERNLTDVRTRMGTLIEFELARISNELLPELGIDDIFWSYVVANRFPDLEIRRNNGDRLLRLEIKCLQCIAEEKSANYDTLKKDIDPNTDFVVVCLWDWMPDGANACQWDTAPQIMKAYVFHAYSLTLLRDTYWLNRPPANLGEGYQGFDVRFAVTCNNSVFSKEQGNYGKLTRIWKQGFEYRPVESAVLLDTESEYFVFQEQIIRSGFDILAKRQLSQLTETDIEEIVVNAVSVGYKSNNIAYITASAISPRRILEFATQQSVEYVVTMTEKYKSTIYQIAGNQANKIARDIKPKNIVSIINQCEN